ncbi:hypothetical protein ACIBF7_03465 [Nonomuraea sp. NPDC050478]|uniref:hypothetical protein n=1 Tax=Nonomuraea sp. NPDC050478 TaxID=3364365 RepID=UPI00378BA55F
MNVLQQAAQRFPLIARPRPACLPLKARVTELRALIDTAAQGTDSRRLTLASEVLNKAALIASDCGDAALARSLCWRHFTAYLPAWPLDAPRARSALEPLVNLARLAIREGDGTRGYRLLKDLFHSVSTASTADIDGHEIPFDGLTRTYDDLHTVRKWLWGVFLAEGIRALISAGQWEHAVAHAQQYRGVGQRLLDGRQALIVASCLAGHTNTALKLVADSTPDQPWEHAVAACLDVLCSRAAEHSVDGTGIEAQRQFLQLDRTPGLLVFRTRLGLTILDLIADSDRSLADYMFTYLISEILAASDGYVAREVLTHNRVGSLLSLIEQHKLTSAMRDSGLGLGAIPAALMSDLSSAVRASEAVIEASLGTPRCERAAALIANIRTALMAAAGHRRHSSARHN